MVLARFVDGLACDEGEVTQAPKAAGKAVGKESKGRGKSGGGLWVGLGLGAVMVAVIAIAFMPDQSVCLISSILIVTSTMNIPHKYRECPPMVLPSSPRLGAGRNEVISRMPSSWCRTLSTSTRALPRLTTI